jgi:hypothetical protein
MNSNVQYITITVPIMVSGCENSFLTLRQEHRMRIFGNRVLRRILGPKTEKVTGGSRKLHNEERI